MKWAADWWGVEIIAEEGNEVSTLLNFTANLKETAVQDYGIRYPPKNKFEKDTKSKILQEYFPMVLRFNRED